MKYSLLLFALTASLCLADNPPDANAKVQQAEIRKEHEEIREQNGQVVANIDTIYRGKLRILVTYKRFKKHKSGIKMVRAYFANGKDVVDELDYDDGTQVVRLYKDEILSEMFRRQADGSVEPVSTKELGALKAQQQELLEKLKK